MRPLLSLTLLCLICAVASAQPVVSNADFETWQPVNLNDQGLYSEWKLPDPPQIPAGWTLNSAYWGELAIGTENPHGGKQFARFAGREGKAAHLYQPIKGLEPGQWYRVSFFSRGGPVEVCLYQYFKGKPMNAPSLGRKLPSADWQEFVGYVQIARDDFDFASLAMAAAPGQPVDVDDVKIEPLQVPELGTDAPAVTVENENLRLALTPDAHLGSFYLKATKTELAVADPAPVVTLVRDGRVVPVHSVSGTAERMEFKFLEADARVALRFVPRKQHFLIEVLDVQPANADSLAISLPVKRLKTLGGAFGANYDETAGTAIFCATNNTSTQLRATTEIAYLGGGSRGVNGYPAAKLVLIGVPGAQFKAAVIEAERANDIPCPVIGGKWARESESNRKSYLFATDARDGTIDQLIKIAKTGGFGTIIFLKDNWLSSHGHYDINTKNFADGIKSVQAAVKKIHAAGLEAGVHIFGPSVSPTDSWVTPKPDPRLFGAKCPPLTEAIDEKTTTITVGGEPSLPPKTPRSLATPGYHIQIGDEIIQYRDIEMGNPSRFVGCVRGAYGTTKSAHAAGAPVKGLVSLWSYFLIDPDSTLADEMTTNFAKVIDACDFDFVYFDASDGILYDYTDRSYYLNKLHMMYYKKFAKPMLYQTSNGTGSDLVWHIVPRSASADGHGDLKGYLDQRWPGILGMGNNWTKADIGWYYWFSEVRPDQIEYVCTRALGVDGNISLETSVEATERLVQSRQMYDMIGRWEQARRENVFDAGVKAKLLEMQRDFKLFRQKEIGTVAASPDSLAPQKGFVLYRAKYEEPRTIDVLDGEQNSFTINNDLGKPCLLGFEFIRAGQGYASGDYDDPKAVTVETFDDIPQYNASERNKYEQFVVGDRKKLTPGGAVREDVTQSYSSAPEPRVGGSALLLTAENKGEAGGWGGIGRRFAEPINLSGFAGVGVWIKGDAKGEMIRIQFRDTQGRSMDFLPVISYNGWKLHFFPLPADTGFDWTKVAYLLFYFNNIPEGQKVQVSIDDLKMLPALRPPVETGRPVLEINGQRTVFPTDLIPGRAIANEGLGGTKLYSGGLRAGEPVAVPKTFTLQPGESKITFTWDNPQEYPGNIHVLFYRLWPMEK